MRVNAAGAERGRGKAPGQREVLMHPGFPGSAEEMSRVTGMPVPPTYADVASNPFIERDVRPKTEASRRTAGGQRRAKQSATTASDTPPQPAPRRRPRVPRLEEAETGEELVPVRSVEATPDARSMVVSLTRRIGSLEARMARSETLLDRVSRIQSDQVAAFGAVNHNLNRLTESLARLDVSEMKLEMVGAMRDMIREESVAQLCAQRARHGSRRENSSFL